LTCLNNSLLTSGGNFLKLFVAIVLVYLVEFSVVVVVVVVVVVCQEVLY
jgi:hypothetical protein